jgi:large subunit ribosomal protein L23
MADTASKAQVAKTVKADLVVAKNDTAVATTAPTGIDLTSILVKPRITEKSSISAEKNVYVFEVSERATKNTIAKAVKQFYNVTPVKVAVARIPKKYVIIRGKHGVRGGGRKAYVYLAQGQTIEFA